MHPALRAVVDRPLAVTAAFALCCLAVVATAVPGYVVSVAHVELSVSLLVFGPPAVAVGVFYALADDADPAWVAVVGAVGLAASVVGLFVGFLAVVGGPGPYLAPGRAGPNDVYLVLDNAVQFLVPTAVLAAGAAACARFRSSAARLAVLAATAVALVPATVFAATIVSSVLA